MLNKLRKAARGKSLKRRLRATRLKRRIAQFAAVLAAVAAAGRAWADSSDALLNVLISKGILTEQEAEKIKQEAGATATNAPAFPNSTTWKLGNAMNNIELFGDIRLRYEDREAKAPDYSFVRLQRLRYALRFGFRGDAKDGFYYGFRLETSSNPRSPWDTFGTSTSTSAGTYQAPFGKGNGGLAVGQIYLGYRPTDWADFEVGKVPQPLYTTPMVWDTDYNPEGFVERFKQSVGQVDFFATFCQFLYLDVNPADTSAYYFPGSTYLSGSRNSDPFLLAWQIGANVHVTKNISVKVAPVLYNYTGEGVNSVTSPVGGQGASSPSYSDVFVGQGVNPGYIVPQGGVTAPVPDGLSGYGQGNGGQAIVATGPGGLGVGPYDGFTFNQTGINNLLVLDIPGEIDLDLDGLKTKVFGDFAENLDGAARATAAYQASQQFGSSIQPIPQAETHQDKAYQFGVAVGSAGTLALPYGVDSRKHDWEVRAYWQHVEQYALDPNLLDSDFFEGRGNLQGVYSAIAYSLTDNVMATIRAGYATRIDSNLGTGGSNLDIPQVNPIRQYEIMQLDLSCRF
jgi:hypothetical protein